MYKHFILLQVLIAQGHITRMRALLVPMVQNAFGMKRDGIAALNMVEKGIVPIRHRFYVRSQMHANMEKTKKIFAVLLPKNHVRLKMLGLQCVQVSNKNQVENVTNRKARNSPPKYLMRPVYIVFPVNFR